MEQTMQQIERFLKDSTEVSINTGTNSYDRYPLKGVAIQWRPYGFRR